MALIKVNGCTINPEKVTMLSRTEGRHWSDEAHDIVNYSGIIVHFDAGGKQWIDDPTAERSKPHSRTGTDGPALLTQYTRRRTP